MASRRSTEPCRPRAAFAEHAAAAGQAEDAAAEPVRVRIHLVV